MKHGFWTFMTPFFPISSPMIYFPTTPIFVPLSSFPFLPSSHALLISLPLTLPSLSLSVSLFLSPTHSPIYHFLSYSPHLSLSHSPFSLSLSLSFSPSFPPFLSFPLRLINLFNDHFPCHPLIITDVLIILFSARNHCVEKTKTKLVLKLNTIMSPFVPLHQYKCFNFCDI